MAPATRSQSHNSAAASTLCKALLHEAKFPIEEAVQVLELNIKQKLDLISIEQVALRRDVWMITVGFFDFLIVLEN